MLAYHCVRRCVFKLPAFHKGPRLCRATSTATSATLTSIEKDLESLQQVVNAYRQNPKLQNSVEQVANLIVNAPGIKVTGIGKSGYVGQRMSATLASIGIPSQFIHGTEWYHGDLGSVRENDLIFGITHSGKTAELVDLVPLVKDRGANFCSLIGVEDSPLEKLSDSCILAPVTSEILGKVPSRSIVSQEALINALAYNVVQLTGFTEAGFVRNHPGGSIGQQGK